MVGRIGVVARGVIVSTFVCSYDHPAILRQPLHPLLDTAVAMRATVVASACNSIISFCNYLFIIIIITTTLNKRTTLMTKK